MNNVKQVEILDKAIEDEGKTVKCIEYDLKVHKGILDSLLKEKLKSDE